MCGPEVVAIAAPVGDQATCRILGACAEGRADSENMVGLRFLKAVGKRSFFSGRLRVGAGMTMRYDCAEDKSDCSLGCSHKEARL